VRSKQISILFAGGGTGGHLYPAVAVADELRKLSDNVEIVFAGTNGKIESRVVPELGYKFAPIWISGFRRRFSVENLVFPLKLSVSFVQSFFLIRKCRADVVVGTGGYVSGPVVFVASLLGVPTLIQEQNSYPGLTTRLLASRADQVHLTFEASAKYLRRKDNIRFTGNPTRESVGTITKETGRHFFNLHPERLTLLVFGGSQGAGSMNKAMFSHLDQITQQGVQVIWQTGVEAYESARALVKGGNSELTPTVRVYPFIEQMEFAYGACDLAVCRAGATTLAELTRGGVPSILVPYPHAAADHQTENARTMVEAGASLMLRDDELPERFMDTIMALLFDEERMRRMSERAKSLSRPDAAKKLAREILALAEADNAERREGLQV